MTDHEESTNKIIINTLKLGSKFGEYGEMQKGWTAEDAKGFIKVLSTPLRVYYNRHEDELL